MPNIKVGDRVITYGSDLPSSFQGCTGTVTVIEQPINGYPEGVVHFTLDAEFNGSRVGYTTRFEPRHLRVLARHPVADMLE